MRGIGPSSGNGICAWAEPWLAVFPMAMVPSVDSVQQSKADEPMANAEKAKRE